MRPVRLTMQAFGPYAGRVVVDFRDAIASGLFGIYGPTGSGKSSIFSAMTFALFGEAAKAEQETASLRSDHADPGVPTEVEFVFDIADKRYVLRRRPEQTRPKQRGDGETRDIHEAWLFDATGLSLEDITDANPGQVIVEKKTGPVKEAVVQLLGYGAEQFRQIVLLPQGKFETFMAAKTDKRLEILRELFDVSMYRRMAAKFKEDAAAAERRVRQEREVCAGRLSAEGFESPDALAAGIDEAQVVHDAETLKEMAAAQTFDASRTALAAARQLEDQFRAAEKARSDVEALIGKAEHIRELQERVDNAKRAQALLDVERHAKGAETESLEAEETMRAAAEANSAAAEKAGAAARMHEEERERSGEVEALRQAVGTLGRHQLTLSDASLYAQKSDAALKAVQQAKKAFDRVEARIEEMRGRKLEKERALGSTRENDAARQRLVHQRLLVEHELKTAELHQAALDVADRARVEMQALKAENEEAVQWAQAARSRFDAAEAALAEAQAIHLAAKLAAGGACPVCGSTEHPLPALGRAEHAGLDQSFRDAKAQWEEAQRSEQDASRLFASAQAKWQERQERLGALPKPEQPAADLRTAIAGLGRKIEELGPAIDLVEAEAALTTLATEIGSTEQERDGLRTEFERSKTNEALARDRFEQAIATVPQELRTPDALTAVLSEHERQLAVRMDAARVAEDAARRSREAAIIANTAADAARQAYENAIVRRDKAQAEFQARLAKSGLTEPQFSGFKQLVGAIEADAQEIADYRNALAIAHSNEETSRRAVEGRERPDTRTLQEAYDTADEMLDLAKTARAQAQARLRQLEKLQLDIAGQLKRLDEIETETASLRTLAALFNAENPLRLDLETYAIGAMFDQVLVAANQRLGPMSGGRFSLEREIEGGAGRSRRGLGIRVFDVHTGKARPTSTLSGGETFMAALALALGLSDIVESVSGQVRLDTIFIDEGFGSLDTQNESGSLDQVLQVLTNLVGQRRVVGLISHVPLVQETIPNGFYVRKEPRGSFVEARGMN
ncbi:AAA family ATPase [Rhizobium mongolense]|uniref:AAA family ATPase n=1 Tax=Rhizobium mongolense TaxID=57676 RepID=UPI003557A5E3